jgi:hypothetical protein
VEEIEGCTIPDVLEVLFLRRNSYKLAENSSIPGQFDNLNMPNKYDSPDFQSFLGDIIT